ncbi:MAG: glycosyltransferase family 4 protein [Candidatus Altiarchaeia archaeon]
MKEVCIIGGGLGPHYNEAMANQIKVISKRFNAPVLTCNDIGWKPFLSDGRYIIINSRFLMRRTPVLSIINGAFLFLAIKLYQRRFKTILLSGGIEGEFIGYLPLEKCIPLIASIDPCNSKLLEKITKYGPRVKKIIAQSKKVRHLLQADGIKEEKIEMLYPVIDYDLFPYSEPSPMEEFRILFASSPNLEAPGEDNFTDKGVPLLLEAFKEFSKIHKSRLILVWRGKYRKQLDSKLNELGLKNVEVIDGNVDMPKIYSGVHVTMIPFINLKRSPDIPSTAIESLASGRPVIATKVAEISEIITNNNCGVAADVTLESLLESLNKCKQEYDTYRQNCRPTFCNLFVYDEKNLMRLLNE